MCICITHYIIIFIYICIYVYICTYMYIYYHIYIHRVALLLQAAVSKIHIHMYDSISLSKLFTLPTAARKSKASTPFCHLLREILIQVYIYSVAACCSIFHRVAACCSIFHRVAVCCSVFFSGAYRARS